MPDDVRSLVTGLISERRTWARRSHYVGGPRGVGFKSGRSDQDNAEKYSNIPHDSKRVENTATERTGINGHSDARSVPLNGTRTARRNATGR